MRIELCGNIASGKTTLTNEIGRHGYQPINENYSSCPFLESFYIDLKSFAFETEFFFPLDHLHQINKRKNGKIVCDYSFALDYTYSKLILNDCDRSMYFDMLKLIISKIKKPHKIIRITCPINDLICRIKRRNRKYESTITYEFLEKLEIEIDNSICELYPNVELLKINNSDSANIKNIIKSLNDNLHL